MNKYLVRRITVDLFTYEADSDTATKICNPQVALGCPEDLYNYGRQVYHDFRKNLASGQHHSFLANRHGCDLYVDNNGQWQYVQMPDVANSYY